MTASTTPKHEPAGVPSFKDALRSGRNVFIVTFLTTWAGALMGWLGQLREWASAQGGAPFPSTSVLGYAAVSAGIAAAPAAVMVVWRSAQIRLGVGKPPVYTHPTPAPTTYTVGSTAPSTSADPSSVSVGNPYLPKDGER